MQCRKMIIIPDLYSACASCKTCDRDLERTSNKIGLSESRQPKYSKVINAHLGLPWVARRRGRWAWARRAARARRGRLGWRSPRADPGPAPSEGKGRRKYGLY